MIELACFETLALDDVCRAADSFRSVYEASGGTDGFVSIEVRPHLAYDTEGSIAEARRLWTTCGRPNVMIKIPATREGLPAIQQCLSDGLNINITRLFSLDRYRQVMEAYVAAHERRVSLIQPIDRRRSVASFFVSRVDTNADAKLDAITQEAGRSDRDRALARTPRGKVAIASARIAYQAFEETFHGSRFTRLADKGGHVQRALWASTSTSTKDPADPALYYVEALIAPDTVDTMPPETFEAYRHQGNPRVRIYDDLPLAVAVFADLANLRIDARQIARKLEKEGIAKFAASYDKILKAVERKERMLQVA